nr:MAG TPA: hypothetical protein [Caudoviricetes sp.]
MSSQYAGYSSDIEALSLRIGRYGGNFRYLLLKCVDRWNVYYTHSLSLPYSLVYSVRILSPLTLTDRDTLEYSIRW